MADRHILTSRLGQVVAQEAFDALADPTRRQILQYLARQDEASAGEVANQIGNVGRTAVSSHLRVLRTSSLIVERREGRFRYYSLDANGPVREVLRFMEELLDSSLTDLKPAGATARSARSDARGGARKTKTAR